MGMGSTKLSKEVARGTGHLHTHFELDWVVRIMATNFDTHSAEAGSEDRRISVDLSIRLAKFSGCKMTRKSRGVQRLNAYGTKWSDY